jgi:hypothetical protein
MQLIGLDQREAAAATEMTPGRMLRTCYLETGTTSNVS